MVCVLLVIIVQGEKRPSIINLLLYLQRLAINKYNCVHKILLTLISKILIFLLNTGDALFNLEPQSIKSWRYNSVNEQEKSITDLSADTSSDSHKRP